MINIKLSSSIVLLLAITILFAFPSSSFAVIQNLNGQTGQTQTFHNDSNLSISSSSNTHSLDGKGYYLFLGVAQVQVHSAQDQSFFQWN